MKSNLDVKVSSLFKEKKKTNTKIKIKLESDSEDSLSVIDKESSDFNGVEDIQPDFEEKEKISKSGNINLDENKENIKSSSQSSNSTSASQSNNSSNSKNFPALAQNPKKADIFSKKNENKCSEKGAEEIDLFNLSSGTKKILDKIREKHRKAKKENKIILSNYNYSFSDINSKKDSKKFIGKKTKSYDTNNNVEIKKVESIKLSERTQEAIKKLKKLRSNKFENENLEKVIKVKVKRVNSFSNLHVKYDELLQPSRELRLPIIYKKLLDSFISLEKTINRNKKENKNNLNTFNNIRNIIVSYTNKNFNINIFKQILYIVPHFYILKYVNSNKLNSTFSLNEGIDKNYDLLIDIPNDFNERIKRNYSNDFNFLDINFYSENNNKFEPLLRYLTEKEMNQRKHIFQNILNYIVNDYHKKFLEENKIKIKFEPLTQKTWHHNFDPDKMCAPIPFFEFPAPPENKSIFVETINKNDIKAQISLIKYDDNVNNINENNNSKKKDTIIKSSLSSASKFVSEDYIKKIRAKEQALNIVKEINQYNYYYNHKQDRNKIIKNMLLQVKTFLMTHNKSLELNVLSDLILNSNRIFKDFFENTQNINDLIIKYCKKNEGFIKISNHSRLGLIVVLVNYDYIIPDKFNEID